MSKQPVPLRDVLDKPMRKWLGIEDGENWDVWRAFILAFRGEPLTDEEFEWFRRCTKRETMPTAPFREAWVVVGRKGRKSATAAMLAVYAAVYLKWKRITGETVRVLVVAMSKDQAKIVRDYAEDILNSQPGWKRLIVASDSDSITLANGTMIQCVSNSFRSIRGPTVCCAICDEVAFWYSDEGSANPDKEVLRALRPAMITQKDGLLIGLSSPYAQYGVLFEKYDRHFGRDDSRVLVWQASTETMNPQADAEAIALEYGEDPVAAAAEYGAQFRGAELGYVTREVVMGCVDRNVHERPPQPGTFYVAFADPSGGISDSFTLAIAHEEGGLSKSHFILDAMREWKPTGGSKLRLGETVKEAAALLKSYGISELEGDKYAGLWPVEQFAGEGIAYEQSARPKSDLYVDFLPHLNTGRARLLDNDVLINQLCSLERKTARSGKDSIDHRRGAHDDVCNVVAGAMVKLVQGSNYDCTMSWVSGPPRRRNGKGTIGGTYGEQVAFGIAAGAIGGGR